MANFYPSYRHHPSARFVNHMAQERKRTHHSRFKKKEWKNRKEGQKHSLEIRGRWRKGQVFRPNSISPAKKENEKLSGKNNFFEHYRIWRAASAKKGRWANGIDAYFFLSGKHRVGTRRTMEWRELFPFRVTCVERTQPMRHRVTSQRGEKASAKRIFPGKLIQGGSTENSSFKKIPFWHFALLQWCQGAAEKRFHY